MQMFILFLFILSFLLACCHYYHCHVLLIGTSCQLNAIFTTSIPYIIISAGGICLNALNMVPLVPSFVIH